MVYKYIQENDKIEVDAMQRIRKFAQTKFRTISKDLDMNTVPVDEPAKLAKFYPTMHQRPTTTKNTEDGPGNA